MAVHEQQADATAVVRGVVALERAADSAAGRPALGQDDTGRLVGLIGRDLNTLAPGADQLDLVFAAAHFDPAEVLRPGWPLHQRLSELRARAPRDPDSQARIIAFGADARGLAPKPLQADTTLDGGPLRVLPFLLAGAPETVAAIGARLEQVLLDTGMLQADTALLAQQAFGVRLEHARYLTAHDLAAMTALQYRHQGLEALWPVIETALLRPEQEIIFNAPPEPMLRYVDGEARIAMFPPDVWRRHYVLRGDGDPAKIERIHQLFQARQRQFAAVLRAHAIPVTFAHCADGDISRL